MANVYWTRSLVPILKKSTSFARSSLMIAAAGVSIMMPMATLPNGTPCSFSSSRTEAAISFAFWTSQRDAIIGNMMEIFPNALAR